MIQKCRDVGFLPAAVLLAALSGCTPSQYAGQADRDALRTVEQGNQRAMGRPEAFGVAYKPYRPEANEPNAPIIVGGKAIATALTAEGVNVVAASAARRRPATCARKWMS